jgi:hypothetical protein
MVPSGNGDHPMTKLSDTQAVILSAASQRDDGAVLPLPEAPKIKGGAVDEDGLFGVTRAGWRPDRPDACNEPFVPLLWLKVRELLGRVPEGSTARFVKDGTLPGEAQGGDPAYRLAS